MVDVLIIGGGPAGISAALYAKRAGADVLVVYNKETLEKDHKIDNYYGFENGTTLNTLYQNGLKQARNLGIKLELDEVTGIEYNGKTFKVNLTKKCVDSKSVIISTGQKRNKPNIKGINEFEGKGVSYCAICDSFFYRNKDVIVIGDGDFAISEAKELSKVVKSVKIVTNSEKKIESEFEVINKKIAEICGEEKVSTIKFEDNCEINIDGVFVALGVAGGVDFAKTLGLMLDKNNIKVNEEMETNIKGVYACGDITGGLLQISKAVYEGAKAGINASNYVKIINKEEN